VSIAPIVKLVTVPVPPERAFALFTGRIGSWWPFDKTVGKRPAAIVLEPGAGGRWFERDAEGVETQWGRVLDWAPPARITLAWQLDAGFRFDPDFETEVEISFTACAAGTEVRLEHRCLERFGTAAETMAGKLGGGWPLMLGCYRTHVQEEAE